VQEERQQIPQLLIELVTLVQALLLTEIPHQVVQVVVIYQEELRGLFLVLLILVLGGVVVQTLQQLQLTVAMVFL
jgi:hypothetical protein